MSVEVFTSFIFWVILFGHPKHIIISFILILYDVSDFLIYVQFEIAAAADTAVWKYKEDMDEKNQSQEGILTAMRSAAKDLTSKLTQKLGKLTAVANPNLGSDWLKEI